GVSPVFLPLGANVRPAGVDERPLGGLPVAAGALAGVGRCAPVVELHARMCAVIGHFPAEPVSRDRERTLGPVSGGTLGAPGALVLGAVLDVAFPVRCVIRGILGAD